MLTLKGNLMKMNAAVCELHFDYESLDPNIVADAKDAVRCIRNILKHTIVGIIEVGERLGAIKGRLPHGQFSSWIAAEFGMSDRTARSYMSAAEFAAGKRKRFPFCSRRLYMR